MDLRKLLTAVVISAAMLSAQAHAGGMAEPLMEPEVVAEEATTSGGFIIPLVILAVIVAAISSSGGGGGGGAGTK